MRLAPRRVPRLFSNARVVVVPRPPGISDTTPPGLLIACGAEQGAELPRAAGSVTHLQQRRRRHGVREVTCSGCGQLVCCTLLAAFRRGDRSMPLRRLRYAGLLLPLALALAALPAS